MSIKQPTAEGGFCARHGGYQEDACPRCDRPVQLMSKPPATPATAGKPPNAARHARLVLEFIENGQPQHGTEDGMAIIDGGWVLFLQDGAKAWQSWPARNIVRIEWM